MGALTEEVIREFKAAQEVYEKKSDDHISVKELPSLLRSLGLDPDENDLKEISKKVKMNDDTINFPGTCAR
jgi:Ca2+-binding EF-hand superfamily protein